MSILVSFLILCAAVYSVIVTDTFYTLSTPSTEPDIIVYCDNNQTLQEIYTILEPHTHGIRQIWEYQKTWGALTKDNTLIPIEIIKLVDNLNPISINKPELHTAEHIEHGNSVYLATEKKYSPFKSIELPYMLELVDSRSSVPTLIMPPEQDVTLTTPGAIGIFITGPITPSYLYGLCSILEEHGILATPSIDKNSKKGMLFSLLKKACMTIQIALLLLLAISLTVLLFYLVEGYQQIKKFLISRSIPVTTLRIVTYLYSLAIATLTVILPIVLLFNRSSHRLKYSLNELDSDEKVIALFKLWLGDSCPSILVFSSVTIIVCFLLWVLTREQSKTVFSKKHKPKNQKSAKSATAR